MKESKKLNIAGPYVMQERVKQGYTRKELLQMAEVYGIRMSVRTLSLIERQKRALYDKEFYALFTALELPLNMLLEIKED